MSKSIHLDARVWDEDVGNDVVLLPIQPFQGGSIGDLINAILLKILNIQGAYRTLIAYKEI